MSNNPPVFTPPNSTTGSVYGSGAWLSAPVDVTGWPSATISAGIINALQAALPKGQTLDLSKITGQQLAQALAHMSNGDAAQRQVVSQVQQMLWYSGAYPSTVKAFTDLQPGVFSDVDTTALGKMVTSAQQDAIPFGHYLDSSANYGQANGAIQAAQGVTGSVIQPPNPTTEDAALKNAAQKFLGQDPSPQQLAEFRAFYTQTWLDGAKKYALAQQQGTASGLPDVGTLAQAIADQHNPPPASPPLMTNTLPSSQGRNPDFAGQPTPGFLQQQQDQAALGQMDGVANGLQKSGGVTAVTAAPDVSNAAESWLQQNDTAGVQAHNLSNVMDALQVLTVGAAKVYGRDTFQQNRN
jgi:hypothetical protein